MTILSTVEKSLLIKMTFHPFSKLILADCYLVPDMCNAHCITTHEIFKHKIPVTRVYIECVIAVLCLNKHV